VAEDYFAAMERVEQRLEIIPAKQKDMEVVKVQESDRSIAKHSGQELMQLIERLELPELCFEERLDLTLQLRELFGVVQELEPVMVFA
jgi:hypothetical protein